MSSLQKPGLWRQATLVEPVRFFEDLAHMGVRVNVTEQRELPGRVVQE